jgi:hypothetical protein
MAGQVVGELKTELVVDLSLLGRVCVRQDGEHASERVDQFLDFLLAEPAPPAARTRSQLRQRR